MMLVQLDFMYEYAVLDTLDHLVVYQRVISLLIKSNRSRSCFGGKETLLRGKETERCRSI